MSDSDDPIYAGTKITAHFRFGEIGADLDNDDELADPAVVTIRTMSPAGTVATYVDGTDDEIEHVGTGRFDLTVVLDTAGRWALRGVGSGGGPVVAVETTVDVTSRF
jgi:hypothetical protein